MGSWNSAIVAPLAEVSITDICSRVRRAVSNFLKIGSEKLSFGLTVPLNTSKADVEVLQRPAPDPWRPAARFGVSNHRPDEQRLVRQVELASGVDGAHAMSEARCRVSQGYRFLCVAACAPPFWQVDRF